MRVVTEKSGLLQNDRMGGSGVGETVGPGDGRFVGARVGLKTS